MKFIVMHCPKFITYFLRHRSKYFSEPFVLKFLPPNRLRISGLKREEVAGGWRRLHNEELHDLCASTNVIRVMKSRRVIWAGHVARIVEMINAYNILLGKPEAKTTLERPRRRWEDNI
jgi:hypothetical protein